MSNYIDSIQLSGTVYTIQGSGGGGTVESAITSGSTNAVESKAIYDATHIDSFDLWTATDTNNYGNNTQSLYKVYVQYTGDTALDEQVQVEIYYGSNFTREAITGNVYQETASTSSVFTSTFDNGKWIIESSSPNYIRNIYADYRFKIWVFIRAISDNFAADSIKDDIIPYINDVDTIARNAVTGGNLMRGDSNKELRLLLQKGNGGSDISVTNLDDLKCSNNGTLSTDIQIPTGEIGWTEITPQNNCTAGNMPTNKVKVTYSGQTVSANYRRLRFNAVFATNVNTDYYSVNINWSNTTTPTVNGCSAVTATYDSTDDSVTIELPTGETTYNGSTGTFSIKYLSNNYCQFGTGISSVKCYGDITEDIYTAMAHKQNTLSAGTGIEISGNVISATGGGGGTVSSAITSGDTNAVAGGAIYDKFDEVEQVTARALNDLDEKINPTVELTQAEYDALVTAGTVSADTYYLITDATPVDVSQYWTSAQTQSAINQATSGKVNTSSVVSSVTSASTDSEIPTAKAVWEAASGGGTTYTAGRGISIANDTVSFNLPISAGTGTNSVAEGLMTIASGQYGSHAEGYYTIASGSASHAEGARTKAIGESSHAEGLFTIANNFGEHASGRYNVSSSASTTFGDSGNTLFSVGNGTSESARHNAFEIRQNGDIYLTSGGTDIKLQDHLGGGGSSINVVQTTGTSTTDVMSQDAVTTAINTVSGAIPTTYVSNVRSDAVNGGIRFFQWEKNNNGSKSYTNIWNFKINNNRVLTSSYNGDVVNYNLVETSAITTSVTSSSTDAQVPSAKAVYNAIQEGGGGGTVSSAITSGDTNAVAGGAVYNKIDEIEQVTARALNQLNAKIAEIEEVVARALNQLNDRITALENV